VDALAIDRGKVEAGFAGTRLKLSRLEFTLLCHLPSEPLGVSYKRELLRDVWGYETDTSTRTLDAHACSSGGRREARSTHPLGALTGRSSDS
jgi:DNA-binding response OmpR family regulator